MAVVVRLARHGAKKRPFFRMVVADKRFPKEGRCIETIGSYDPNVDPPAVQVKQDRLDYWCSKGAQLTPTVKQLCKPAASPDKTPTKK